MSPNDLTRGPVRLVTTPEGLGTLTQHLKAARRVALDTEAASFHRFRDRVYLVQVSSDHETAVVDPVALEDLSPLGEVLADPSIETIFHDADYDLRILDRDYGFTARNVWDTRIAAQLLGEPGVGLAALLEKHFGIRLDKKLQRADWSERPLTPEMIDYAASDTMHLPALRDTLEHLLVERGRLDWAREEFGHLENLRWTLPAPDGEGYLRLKGLRTLSPRALAAARALWDWRERTAQALDRAPFRVLGNEQIVAIAKASPTDQQRLEAVPGLPSSIARRHGSSFLEVVGEALALPERVLPRIERGTRTRPDPAADQRLVVLKDFRNRRAEALGMEPGVLCPNGTLAAIAKVAPGDGAALRSIPELRRWQIEALGEAEILGVLGPRATSA